METEEIAVVVRPRASLEAADLGFALARAYWRPLFGAHSLVVLPLAAALALGLRSVGWTALVLWWLKPLYDRVSLHVLSIALLGRAPKLGETFAALPRLVFRTGLLQSLTWLRLTPTRSFFAPVLQLEGLRGRARARRVRVLAERESAAAAGLMFVCSTIELAVIFAGLQVASTFWNGSGAEFWKSAGGLGRASPELEWLELALYVVALCTVEPFYVAGGFALYINRRVWLEGWDVELAFRRLERRLRAAAALAAFALLVAPPLHARAADEPPCKADTPEDAGDCIDQVLKSPDFARTRKVEQWRLRAFDWKLPGSSGFWDRVGNVLSATWRVVAWLTLPIVLAILAVAIARGMQRVRPDPRGPPDDGGEVRRAFDLRPESLPADVVSVARARFAAGDPAGALSLLYRGALVELGRRFGVRLPASATEGECERIASSALEGALAQDFARLARAWLYCAYARRPPSGEEFERLCSSWSAGWGSRA